MKKQINYEKYEKVVETVERRGLSNNMAAHLINDTLAACGEITDKDQGEVFYKKKVERMRNKMRLDKVEETKGKAFTALMFDERKDMSKRESGIGIKNHKEI